MSGFLILWCGIMDLNHHGVTHTALNRTRLPIPPIPRINIDYISTNTRGCKANIEIIQSKITANIWYYSAFFSSSAGFLPRVLILFIAFTTQNRQNATIKKEMMFWMKFP